MNNANEDPSFLFVSLQVNFYHVVFLCIDYYSENVIEAMDTNSEAPRINRDIVVSEGNEDLSVRAGQLLDEVDDHLHNINNQIITRCLLFCLQKLIGIFVKFKITWSMVIC